MGDKVVDGWVDGWVDEFSLASNLLTLMLALSPRYVDWGIRLWIGG